MSVKVQDYLEQRIMWQPSEDPEYPYVADLEGERCLVRVNDFPDDHFYTLIVGDLEVAQFDEWPKHWRRARALPRV